MEIRRKTINGNRWELVNEYWETSNSWGHKTTIIRNGYDYEPHKIRYYNRTWEAYTFQSCMSGAVSEIKEEELNRYIENYKSKNNVTRFKRGEKEKVIFDFEGTEIGKELNILSKTIRERSFE